MDDAVVSADEAPGINWHWVKQELGFEDAKAIYAVRAIDRGPAMLSAAEQAFRKREDWAYGGHSYWGVVVEGTDGGHRGVYFDVFKGNRQHHKNKSLSKRQYGSFVRNGTADYRTDEFWRPVTPQEAEAILKNTAEKSRAMARFEQGHDPEGFGMTGYFNLNVMNCENHAAEIMDASLRGGSQIDSTLDRFERKGMPWRAGPYALLKIAGYEKVMEASGNSVGTEVGQGILANERGARAAEGWMARPVGVRVAPVENVAVALLADERGKKTGDDYRTEALLPVDPARNPKNLKTPAVDRDRIMREVLKGEGVAKPDATLDRIDQELDAMRKTQTKRLAKRGR